jgi:hypothetical protein
MAFSFRPAKREAISLILGLAGPSGGGKTWTAMVLAKGLAAGQPFAVIDTEAGRAKHYADAFKFDHGDLAPPFRPDRYVEAIKAADAAGYPVIVVDSFSHEHAGEGGLLDWHEEEWQRMGGKDSAKMLAWVKPKTAHRAMISKLLQVRAHLILCMRAEEKIDMVRNPNTGKTEIVPKQTLAGYKGWIPICEKNLPFELTASFILTPDKPGYPQPIKLPDQFKPFFPLDQPISEASGQRLAEWAKGGATAGSGNPTSPTADLPGATSGGGTGGTPELWEVEYAALAERLTEIKFLAEFAKWRDDYKVKRPTFPKDAQSRMDAMGLKVKVGLGG